MKFYNQIIKTTGNYCTFEIQMRLLSLRFNYKSISNFLHLQKWNKPNQKMEPASSRVITCYVNRDGVLVARSNAKILNLLVATEMEGTKI